jgi:hypothetical protein
MAKRTPSTPPVSHSLSPMAARQRRLQAARLFAQGLPQAEVARRLEVSRQTASRWHARWLKGGRAGLAGPGRWGRPSRLGGRLAAGGARPCWPARKPTGSTPTCGPCRGSPR